eukprot:CAMPEP_0174251446 /NCGR_PEP_ID=MMETSP0439-20130205/1267_1 /TAXON_ID=0 /ORGANISM="Stereomyxa ramosa, Strain Chinc5" /LENGTH=142 /DNA_ID=CAMNT_0015331765 /DNA_START=13 /DNA_END=438 /DNA_ORIENTATION=+
MSWETIRFESCDEEIFEIPVEIAEMWTTIRYMFHDEDYEAPILLHNVSGKVLRKVVEWCKYHHSHPQEEDGGLSDWDKEFFDVDLPTLFLIIPAANFLDIPLLLELSLVSVANLVKGTTVEGIRSTFGIPNEFTQEEELLMW